MLDVTVGALMAVIVAPSIAAVVDHSLLANWSSRGSLFEREGNCTTRVNKKIIVFFFEDKGIRNLECPEIVGRFIVY